MPTTAIDGGDVTDDGILLAEVMVRCGLAKSRGEAKRLIDQGGVSVNGEKVSDQFMMLTRQQLSDSVKIQKGKKVFHKAVLG